MGICCGADADVLRSRCGCDAELSEHAKGKRHLCVRPCVPHVSWLQFSSRGFQRHRHLLTCGATLGVRGGRNIGLTEAPRICCVAKLTDNIAQRRHDSCWDGSFWHCSCSACYSAETCLPRHPGTSDRIPLRFDVSPACGKSVRCRNESTGPYVSMGCRVTR